MDNDNTLRKRWQDPKPSDDKLTLDMEVCALKRTTNETSPSSSPEAI